MTPQQAAAELQRRANALRQAQSKIQADVSRAGIEAGQKFTHGGYSQAALNALGNPYSAANPRPPANPGIINFQSDGVYEGWRTKVVGGSLVLYNIAPEAIFLDPKYRTGNAAMMLRPITDLIVKELNKSYKQIVRARVMEALNP